MLVVQTLIACACFLVFPVEGNPTPLVSEGRFAVFFHLADFLNMEENYAPALHVSYAFTTALAIGRRGGPLVQGLLLVWASGIVVSALLLHQHYLADIVAALVLAVTMMGWLYPRASEPEFLRALRVELTCLAEIYRFSRRHLRYLVVGLLIYRQSLFHWQKLRPVRVGFCFLQHIDDVLDGDRPFRGEPAEVADRMIDQIEQGSFDDTPLGCLGRCLWEDMAEYQAGADHPREELVLLIRRMQCDRYRVKDHVLLSQKELLDHLHQTFHYAVNLMLILGGAELRARDAPDLIEAFGWCSTMRDLQDDIEKGLVNIPASIVEEAYPHGPAMVQYETLVRSPAVQQWMRSEHARALRHLDRFEVQLKRLQGKRGVAILRLFHRSILRFAKREATVG